MSNFANLTDLSRAEFITAITAEFNRAFEGVTERSVQEYVLYAEDDGDFGAMAEPMRHPGFKFWTVTPEDAEGYTAAEYLGTYSPAMYDEYSNQLASEQEDEEAAQRANQVY